MVTIKKFGLILLFTASALTFQSCKKDDKQTEAPKPCFSNEIAGNYTGDLTDTQTLTSANDGKVEVKVNGCQDLTIKVTSPFTRTYTINSLVSVRSNNSYIAKTTNGDEVAIDYMSSTKKIDITITGVNFGFSGTK